MANYEERNNNSTGNTMLDALIRTASPATKITGMVFEVTTRALGEDVCNIIDEQGIHEIDHVAIFPIKNKQGQITDFGVDAIFNTSKKIPGDDKNITKYGSNNRGRFEDNPILAAAAAKTSNGGYNVTKKFKEVMGSVAITNDNGGIDVLSDPSKDNRLALVECDFLSVISMALDIDVDEPIDFVITGCEPMNNNSGCIDFRLKIEKKVIPGGGKRRKTSSGINYDNRDRDRIRRAEARMNAR